MFILNILKMVLPVLLTIGIGLWCNKKQLFDLNGLATLKTIISNITLPLVLFNAFLTVHYSIKVLLIFILMYFACGIAITLGYLLKPLVKPFGTFMPFLVTCYEVGMLGYALYALLVGSQNTSIMAMPDVGQTMFAYTVYLALLKATDGKKPTVKDLILNVLHSRPANGMMLGILLGVLGAGEWITASPLSDIYSELIRFITAPTACIILIVIGYELSFKKELLRPVFVTTGIRLFISTVLLSAVSFVLFAIIPFDKNLMIALLILFSLPAPFVIPLFADVKNDGEYISTSLSVATLCTIVLFVGVAVYSTM